MFGNEVPEQKTGGIFVVLQDRELDTKVWLIFQKY